VSDIGGDGTAAEKERKRERERNRYVWRTFHVVYEGKQHRGIKVEL
jgi:hypothetical protein